MELQFVQKGLDYARKRKKWMFILAGVGFAGYGAYRVYRLPTVARKRERFSKLLGALVSVAEAISESADTIGVVARDMEEFLQFDSDQVPNSLKQISKITCSDQFSDSLVRVTCAVTVGVLRGYQSVNQTGGGDQTGSAGSMLVDKLFTPAGSGFASVVVGSFARNMVLAFYSDGQYGGGGESDSTNVTGVAHVGSNGSNLDPVPRLVDVVCGDRCRELIGNCVQLFVSTAVAVYLDKTMHINTYDEFFSGLTNPRHETKVRDMLVSVCNGAIETLVQTSHQVLTSPNPNVSSSSTCFLAIEEGSSPSRNEDLGEETSSVESRGGIVSDEEKESGWVRKVSSTLAVPSNRRLVLDVTGRVTFETVRSFLEFLVQTFCACVKRCADVAHEALVEIVRYVTAKFSVIVTICLSLCLHVTGGAWALVPA